MPSSNKDRQFIFPTKTLNYKIRKFPLALILVPFAQYAPLLASGGSDGEYGGGLPIISGIPIVGGLVGSLLGGGYGGSSSYEPSSTGPYRPPIGYSTSNYPPLPNEYS